MNLRASARRDCASTAGQLQRDFHRGRSVVGIEDARQSRAAGVRAAARPVPPRAVRAAGEDHVLELARLRGQRLVQLRMRVAVDVHPPRRNAVEDPAAVLGVEVHAFARARWQAARARSASACRDATGTARSRSMRLIEETPASGLRIEVAVRPTRARHSGVSGSKRGISPSTGTRRSARWPRGCPRSARRP